MVSPSTNLLWTADPNVICQVNSRHWELVKPHEAYIFLALYGPNVVTNVGDEWRAHRKITAPSFNEATHEKVWKYTITQSEQLLSMWFGEGKEARVPRIEKEMEKLTLRVMLWCLYNQELKWVEEDQSTKKVSKNGYRRTFSESMAELLHRVWAVCLAKMFKFRMFPYRSTRSPCLMSGLEKLPSKYFKEASALYTETEKHMADLREARARELESTKSTDEENLLGVFV